ncbi:MAG: hypothetical protein ABI555_06610, partial [Chloroflexota bacterium]
IVDGTAMQVEQAGAGVGVAVAAVGASEGVGRFAHASGVDRNSIAKKPPAPMDRSFRALPRRRWLISLLDLGT